MRRRATESLPGIRRVGGHRAVFQEYPMAPEGCPSSYVNGSGVTQQPCLFVPVETSESERTWPLCCVTEVSQPGRK